MLHGGPDMYNWAKLRGHDAITSNCVITVISMAHYMYANARVEGFHIEHIYIYMLICVWRINCHAAVSAQRGQRWRYILQCDSWSFFFVPQPRTLLFCFLCVELIAHAMRQYVAIRYHTHTHHNTTHYNTHTIRAQVKEMCDGQLATCNAVRHTACRIFNQN